MTAVESERACYASDVSALSELRPLEGDWFSDEPQMETYPHMWAQLVLMVSLKWHWRERRDYFAAGNLTVYYSPYQRKSEDFRGPDFFVVLDTDPRPRNSWMVWNEGGKYPNVIVELLSETTEHVDRGEKLKIYQDIFRTPEYYLFDPHSLELVGYRLVTGRYERIVADAHGRVVCEQMDLRLGVHGEELRFFTRDGALVLKPDEAALEAQKRAAAAETRLAEVEAKLRGT